jgi:hypothetical protein
VRNPYPKKRYAYVCKCGKDPMRGTVQTSPEAERQIFDVLDLAWAESHNKPGCGIKSKDVRTIGEGVAS